MGWVAADDWELGMKSLISVNGLDAPDAAFLPLSVHLPLKTPLCACVLLPSVTVRHKELVSGDTVRCSPPVVVYFAAPVFATVVIYLLILIFTSAPAYTEPGPQPILYFHANILISE